jgi:hypothetical protein
MLVCINFGYVSIYEWIIQKLLSYVLQGLLDLKNAVVFWKMNCIPPPFFLIEYNPYEKFRLSVFTKMVIIKIEHMGIMFCLLKKSNV